MLTPSRLRDALRTRDIDDLDQRDPALMAALVHRLGAFLDRYHRPQVRGLDNVPEGAALYVANHNGGLMMPDGWLLGVALHRAHGLDAVPYGLAHEVILKVPAVNQLLTRVGAVRASHENAARLFARGSKAIVYPGGDVDVYRPWRKRHEVVFGGRKGYIRLALRHGVPIVPVVSCGAHEVFVVIDDMRWLARALGLDKRFRLKVFPLVLSMPWGLTLGPAIFMPAPSQITQVLLPPIKFERSGPEAAGDDAYVAECAARVESVMQATLTRLGAERALFNRG
jgi:1-acyl-sn-glycerol-3-phosphate acyltransferase